MNGWGGERIPPWKFDPGTGWIPKEPYSPFQAAVTEALGYYPAWLPNTPYQWSIGMPEDPYGQIDPFGGAVWNWGRNRLPWGASRLAGNLADAYKGFDALRNWWGAYPEELRTRTLWEQRQLQNALGPWPFQFPEQWGPAWQFFENLGRLQPFEA